MVASKGRVVGGIRILNESKTFNNGGDLEGQENECRRMAKFSRTRLVNASANSKLNTDLENDKGKMRNGRRVLSDIGNLDNRSHQYTNKLNSKPKPITWKNKFDGTKKVELLGSKIPQGFPRLSLTKGIVIADSSLTKSMKGILESSSQISERFKFPARRRTGETLISNENLTELPTFGSQISKIQTGKVPQTRLVVGTKKVAKKTAPTRKPVLENLKNSVQISGKLKFPGRRRTTCFTHISKENHIELPTFGSKISKVQAGKLHQTRFIVASKVAKNATTTRKQVMNASKLQSAVTRKTSIANKFKTIEHSRSKDFEEQGTSNNLNNSKISQDAILHPNGSNFSNDIAKKEFVSGCNCNCRKSYTLSLVAQRVCVGLVNNDSLANIDNFTNPLEVADYVDDIYQYYWTMEVERPSLANYMELQLDITPKMRRILVNWLIEVHHKYQLMEESLFLMIELLNRLLSTINIKKNEFQLFGLIALLLASKYEDYWHPKVGELISLTVNQYTKDEILRMEIFILKKLQFRLNLPTPYVFMLRFLRVAQSDKKLEDLSFYLIELCLVESESMKYRPSLLCASALFVARCSLKLNPPWTGLLRKHARYEESELRNCAEMILRFHRAAACCKPVKYTYHKYLNSDRSCAALIKPVNMLPP